MKAPPPWLVGLQAARANFWPGLCLQGAMFLLVVAYYRAPWAQPFFAVLARWKQVGGFGFSMGAAVLAGAVLPELLVIVFFQGGRFTAQTRTNLLFGVAFWMMMGFVVDAFYRGQALWFGTHPDFATLAKKVAMDQFVFTPIFANPVTVWCYEWRNRSFTTRGLGDLFTPGFYVRHLLPTLIANWGVWLPAATLIYCLPPLLQTPLFSLATTFWAMMLAYISSTARAQPSDQPPQP